jgi:hypothetical protein
VLQVDAAGEHARDQPLLIFDERAAGEFAQLAAHDVPDLARIEQQVRKVVVESTVPDRAGQPVRRLQRSEHAVVIRIKLEVIAAVEDQDRRKR